MNSSISFCAAFACTARRGAGLELGREGGLDGVLPFLFINMPVTVRVEHEQRGLEARRDQQVLEILVAAVVEEVDHFLVSAHGANDLRFSGGSLPSRSMSRKHLRRVEE